MAPDARKTRLAGPLSMAPAKDDSPHGGSRMVRKSRKCTEVSAVNLEV